MSLYKKALLALALVFIVLKANASVFQLFNLEPERISPQKKIDLPKITQSSNFVDYFFEPPPAENFKPGELYPLVHMRIPKVQYFVNANYNGPIRAYDEYIRMFYPHFSGLGDKENYDCLHKEEKHNYGWCKGELVVGVGFSLMLPKTTQYDEYKRFKKNIAAGFIDRTPQISRYGDLDLVAMRGQGPSKRNYYVGDDETGRPGYIFNCSDYVPSPSCEVRFRAAKSPFIYIELTFVRELLPKWRSLIASTQSKVDSMIVKTYFLKM